MSICILRTMAPRSARGAKRSQSRRTASRVTTVRKPVMGRFSDLHRHEHHVHQW
jgi:hypothetical protein